MPEFNLPKELDAAEQASIPDEYKPFYYPKEGKLVRTDPEQLTRALALAKTERAQAKDKLNELESKLKAFGEVTPEEIEALRAKAASGSDADKAEVEKQIAAMRAQIQANADRKLEEVAKENKRLKDTISNRLVKSYLDDAFEKAGVTPEARELLPSYVKNYVKVEFDENGDAQVRVHDGSGNLRLNQQSDPMSLSDLLFEMRSTKAALFHSTTKPGSGSNPAVDSAVANAQNWNTMTDQQKVAFTDRHGLAATQELIRRSGVAKDKK